jgi:hypothetical protein
LPIAALKKLFSIPDYRMLAEKFSTCGTPSRKTGITLSGWTRFAIAFLIIVLGRMVLKIEGRGAFLIDLSRCWKEGCF